MKHIKPNLVWPWLSVMVLNACSLAPSYQAPFVDVPSQFKEAQGPWQLAQPKDDWPRGAWWSVFEDEQLNALLLRLEQGNFSLSAARAQYQQALQLLAQAQAQRLPSVTASVSDNRGATSLAAGKTGVLNTNHLAGLGVAWEADIWGKWANQIDSAQANAQASVADMGHIKLLLQTELVKTYWQLQGADQQSRVLQELVQAYEKVLALNVERFKVGLISRVELSPFRSQLSAAQLQLKDAQALRYQYEHALAVLLGVAPAQFSLPSSRAWATFPKLPEVLPASLLERRPDVAAAERRVAASNAQIGVAKAAFFPSLQIGANLGSESSRYSQWFAAPARFWSVGPSLALTLFDGGNRTAKLAQMEAQSEANGANYRQVVLQAIQEVEDNLSNLRLLGQEAEDQDQSVRSTLTTEGLNESLFQQGVVSSINVLTARAARLQAQKTANDIHLRRLISATTLVKAAGGGWEASKVAQD